MHLIHLNPYRLQIRWVGAGSVLKLPLLALRGNAHQIICTINNNQSINSRSKLIWKQLLSCNVDISKLKDLVKQHPKLAVTYNQTKEFSKQLNKEVEPFVWVGKNSKLVDGATAVDHLSSILS